MSRSKKGIMGDRSVNERPGFHEVRRNPRLGGFRPFPEEEPFY